VKTHIPKPDGRTFCGLNTLTVPCINLAKDAIDDATCRNCQRGDDRRTREAFQKTDEYRAMQEDQ
jgi:hypothetical protein